MFDSLTNSVPINRESQAVYDFALNPANSSLWVCGFGSAPSNGEWFAGTPLGLTKIRFIEHSNFGVLHHYVSPAPGVEIFVPMRDSERRRERAEVYLVSLARNG